MVPHWEPILEIGLFIAGFRHRIQYRSTAGPHPNMILCPPSHQNYLIFFLAQSLCHQLGAAHLPNAFG
jgi:hypothetical protein